MSDAPGFDATAAATRIAELDVAIARADAAIEQAKAERTQIEEALLDYVAATGADQWRVTVTGPDGVPERRTVSPRVDRWAFLDKDAATQEQAVRLLRRHYPELVKVGWNAQTISAVFREARRAIDAGHPDPIPASVRRCFRIDERQSIRSNKSTK